MPFTFPSDPSTPDYSRRVRWPHERHSPNAIDSSASFNAIVFPRSQTSDNDLPTTTQSTESTDQNAIPLIPNAINSATFILNETAIRNGLVPMIYIDDDGIFQVKYAPKGETVSFSSDIQQHQQNFTSINETKEIAIISNDNQQIRLDQHIRSDTNVVNSASPATAAAAAPIDLSQDQTINNHTVKHERFDAHTTSTSPRTVQQQPNQLSGDMQATLFDELPVFV